MGQFIEKAGDQVLYVVVSKGGGMDGRDMETYPPGEVKMASFYKDEATEALDPWHEMEIRVLNVEEATQVALDKLSPIDRLVLGLEV